MLDDTPEPGAADSTTEIQSMGGKARAEKLSPSQRTAIARKAAVARWGGEIPYATHDGILPIGDKEIFCAVLNTRKRVLTQESFLLSMDRAAKAKGGTGVFRTIEGVDDLPPFLAAENLKPFVTDKLRESTTPVIYRAKNGAKVMGFDAILLPLACNVYIEAGLARKLTKPQMRIAEACRRLVQGFAEQGIVSLVDSVTGYGDDRAREEIAKILEAYIAPELAPWIGKFPHEFFRQVYRIHGWPYRPGQTQGPRYIGKFIMKYVYSGFPPEVVAELKSRSPNNEKRQRPRKLFQFLTEETGIAHLDWQISSVTTLMRASQDKPQFEELHARAFLQRDVQLRLPYPDQPKTSKALPEPIS